MDRPTGISIIAVAYIVLGILSLLWSLVVFGVGGVGALFGGLLGAEGVAALGTTSAWSGFVGVFAALVQFAIGFGLLAMKKWAWILALVGVGLTVIEGVLGIFGGGVFAFMCGVFGLIIPVAILIYLLTNNVRDAFGVRTQ